VRVLKKSIEHYLVGKSSIKALFEISDKFDKNLRKEFEKNMAFSHPNINISNLSKVDESDLHNYYFNASYEAEELLLKFIQSNDKIDINNLYFKLNPIFFRQEEAFSDWYDDFRLNEWINNTTTFNDNASLIFFNGGNNKSKEKLAIKKIKIKGYDGSEYIFKKFFLCEHSKCDCFILDKGQAVNSLNAPMKDKFLKIYLDISQLYPEYISFLSDSSQYIFYSGVYKMAELENLSEEVLDVLSQDRVLAKYVARHNNISGKLITKLIKLEDLEINTSLFNNPKVDKGIKKQLLSSGVIDENRYPLSQRIFDLENLGEYDSKYFRLKK
jgi:hypothetical protein